MSTGPIPFDPVDGSAQTGSARAGSDRDAVVAGGATDVVITGEDWLDAICPFLRARDGSWRSASPARDHRCWATDPPSELPVLTQQRLCLVRAHDGCERFLHARELRTASLARERGPSVDTPPAGVSMSRVPPKRSDGIQDALRELIASVLRLPRLVIAAGAAVLAVLVIAAGMAVTGGAPSVTPAPPSIVAERSAGPGSADPTRGPDGVRRYRVREGDTLRTIADRFDVSVRQLRLANDLGDPPQLEAGDIIFVPDGG